MAQPRTTIATLALLTALSVAGLSAQDEGRRYGYIRLLEGKASVLEPGSTDEIEAEVQSPLLTSDRLRVGRGSRLEAVLADLSHLRLDADTEVELTALANSADQNAERTSLRLLTGRLQITIVDPPSPESSTAIVTSNAAVFVQGRGVVLVEVSSEDSTQVTVRGGYAEVVTDRGSSLVRANESAFIDGAIDVEISIAEALPPDGFENWATFQEDRLASVGAPALDARLSYDAASLEGQGDWVEIDDGTAWKPQVDDNWRPYWNGRWSYTPTGLSWISYEPWGWVPYHYGGWDYHSHWGWLWFPGNVFAAAHVQWYWGPTHVGWVPQRYYHHHYRRSYGHHPSHYAYTAHSDGRHYDLWTFVPTDSLGSRDQRHAHRYTSSFRNRGEGAVPSGLISSGSGGLRRDSWQQPGEAHRAFRRRDLDSVSHLDPVGERSVLAQRPSRIGFRGDSQPAPRPAERSTRAATHRLGTDRLFERGETVRSARRTAPNHRSEVAAETLRRGDALSSWSGEGSSRRGSGVRRITADTRTGGTSPTGFSGSRVGERYRGVRIWEIDKAAQPPPRGTGTGGVRSTPRGGREAVRPSSVRSPSVRTSPSAIGAYSRSPGASASSGPSSSGSRALGTRAPTRQPPSASSGPSRPSSRSSVSSSSASRSPSRPSSSGRPSRSGRSSSASDGRVGGHQRH